ncbi:unnamed protein product [Gadus morhua 'NCC']
MGGCAVEVLVAASRCLGLGLNMNEGPWFSRDGMESRGREMVSAPLFLHHCSPVPPMQPHRTIDPIPFLRRKSRPDEMG